MSPLYQRYGRYSVKTSKSCTLPPFMGATRGKESTAVEQRDCAATSRQHTGHDVTCEQYGRDTTLATSAAKARGSKLLEFIPPLFAAFFVPPFVSTLLPVPSGFLAATAFQNCSHSKGMHKDREMCRTVFLLYLQLVFLLLEAPVTHRFPPRLIPLVNNKAAVTP